MKPAQVNACGYYLSAAAGLAQAARGAGQIAAARVGAYHRVRILTEARAELLRNFVAQRFNSYYAVRRIEGGVEVARILKHPQRFIEKLRPHGKLHDFRAEGLALSGLFYYFGLAYIP